MPIIKELTNKYTELWKEYMHFLKLNNIKENTINKVCFVYNKKMFNKGCLVINANLTNEECCMYNWSVDDDCDKILVDNEVGIIYVQQNFKIVAFRATHLCMHSKNYRLLNQWTIDATEYDKIKAFMDENI